MDSFGSFSSNPNPAMGDQLGVVPADEDYFWDSELWRFLDSDDSAGGAAGGDALFGGGGGGDVRVEVEAEASQERKRGKRKTESELENHLSMERERRKKMRNMFSDLHAMLPQLPAKIDKSTIVEEAMKQIKTLEATLEKLQKQKAERARATATATIALEPSGSTAPHMKVVGGTTRESFLADHAASPSPLTKMPSIGQTNAEFRTWNSPNVALNTFGNKGYIMIAAPRRPGLFTSILVVLNKYKIDVEFAQSTCEENQMFFNLHTRLQTDGAGELPPGVSAEGVYKQAAQDLVSLVSS